MNQASTSTPTEIAAAIAEVRKLDAEATKGPWTYSQETAEEYWFGNGYFQIEPYNIPIGGFDKWGKPSPEAIGNAAFIARARTLLPQLADALETMAKDYDIKDYALTKMAGYYEVERKRREQAEAKLAAFVTSTGESSRHTAERLHRTEAVLREDIAKDVACVCGCVERARCYFEEVKDG